MFIVKFNVIHTTVGAVSCEFDEFFKNLQIEGILQNWQDGRVNVLQPYRLIVLPLDLPDLTASLLLWGPSGQRWGCLWTFLFSIVPTFATSRLQEILAAKGGTTWTRNGRWFLPENARLPRNIQGSFTCRKSTTWEQKALLPLRRKACWGFCGPEKSNGFRSGLNPRTWVPKATTLPPDYWRWDR